MIAQAAALVIFIGMFVLIIMDKFERQWITLVSGALMLIVVFGLCLHSPQAIAQTLNLNAFFAKGFWFGGEESASAGINWSTIVFIAGMMIMVEGLGHSGFFRWLCLTLAKAVHYRLVPLLICFMCMSGVLSMFIDSITVVLFLASVTIELSRMLKYNPVPMILSEIFCANLGGAATMSGDPPNIIIGTSLGLTFADFISNTGVIVGICFVFCLVYFWLCFRKELKANEAAREGSVSCPDPSTAIQSRPAFVCGVLVFALAVVLLITHAQTGLTVSCIGVIVAVLTLLAMTVTSGAGVIPKILKGVDYKTLLFFIGLFISVGGLEQTGVLEVIASFISNVSGGNPYVVVAIILILSAGCSALIDNIPFAATMIPVIQSLAVQAGMSLQTLSWTLSLGTDIGGNATPIGASANVVGTSVSAKNGHPISWGKYCKYCVPATVIVIMISLVCVYARYL